MFPWLFIWAPHYYLPWSGSVKQDISPDTQWFFDAIPEQAGNGALEKSIFETASYGKQLGILTDVVLELLAQTPPASASAQQAAKQLQDTHQKIEAIKTGQRQAQETEALRLLDQLRVSDPAAYQRIAARLQVDD